MNPLLQRALESVFRWVLAVAAGWFVQRGIWTDSDATEYVLAGAAGLAVLAWGVWEKYASQRKLNTSIAVTNALTGPSVKNITPADIDVMIGTGSGAAAGTGSGVAPILGTGDGTGNGLADLKQKVGLIKGLVLAAAFGSSLLVSGCAESKVLVTPNPTAAQVQSVRQLVSNVLTGADVTLSNDVKNGYDCALLKTFGTTTPASAPVVKVCGAVPLSAASPFAVGLNELKAVTTCPGLRASAARVLGLVLPLLSQLETSGNASLAFAGLSLRATFTLLRGLTGGTVTCQV